VFHQLSQMHCDAIAGTENNRSTGNNHKWAHGHARHTELNWRPILFLSRCPMGIGFVFG
jgi:hypothetical protein